MAQRCNCRSIEVEVDTEGVPKLRFPDPFNVAEYFIDRHLPEGRGSKAAIRTLNRDITYAELTRNVNRYGNTLANLLGRGERLLMVVKDCPEFFYIFWGAVKAGIIPVPLNTMLRAKEYSLIIQDSGCAGLVYSPEFASGIELGLTNCSRRPESTLPLEGNGESLDLLAHRASTELAAVPSRATDDCFWLYSSGTSGQPKGVVHNHGDIVVTCRNFSQETLGAREDDVFFSIPRLFFSYGMGCAMTTPLWVGGTAILDERRPTPQTVTEIFRRFSPTIFAAVPTFYASLLASELLTRDDIRRLRRCLCGGEAAPAELQRRWLEMSGVPILDVIGSTEVLFIYIANRVDDIRPGSTGKPVPGYQFRIIGDGGSEVDGEGVGRLLIKGQSITKGYWNNPEKTAKAIIDGWFDTGDIFYRDREGYYYYCGRSDDMLKVGARWVSPLEIESTLAEHPKVLEAAVVGRNDENGLVKVEAWIVPRDKAGESEEAAGEIRAYCKSKLAPYKYPRWINFVEQLPKTATGKIQRFKLRTLSQEFPNK